MPANSPLTQTRETKQTTTLFHMPAESTGTRPPPPAPQLSQKSREVTAEASTGTAQRLADAVKTSHMNLADVFIFLATWNFQCCFLSAPPALP